MKVFIWKSYGSIEVYAIETEEQRQSLMDSLVDVLENCDAEDFDPTGMTPMQQFYTLVGRAVEQSEYNNDMFESGTGLETVKE